MYVKRLKIYGARGFRLDLPLGGEGELPPATRKRMLLQGGNGSGKTTVLETIKGLWEWFGIMIEKEGQQLRLPTGSRWISELNAMELGDFPTIGKSFWIAVGTLNGINDLQKAFPETPIASLASDKKRSVISLPKIADWRSLKMRSQGEQDPLPNLVFFPSEGRSIQELPPNEVHRLDLFNGYWFSGFNKKFDLDSMLFTARVLKPAAYDRALDLVDRCLRPSGKRIVRDLREERTTIETASGATHLWTELSAGERQALFQIVFTTIMLRDRSILVMDEPELHLHIGLVKLVVDILYSLVRERNGQFIVASHSPEVWNSFPYDAENIALQSSGKEVR